VVVNLMVDVGDEGVDDADELFALQGFHRQLVIELVNAETNL